MSRLMSLLGRIENYFLFGFDDNRKIRARVNIESSFGSTGYGERKKQSRRDVYPAPNND